MAEARGMIGSARRRVLLPLLDRWRGLGVATRDVVVAVVLPIVAYTPRPPVWASSPTAGDWLVLHH